MLTRLLLVYYGPPTAPLGAYILDATLPFIRAAQLLDESTQTLASIAAAMVVTAATRCTAPPEEAISKLRDSAGKLQEAEVKLREGATAVLLGGLGDGAGSEGVEARVMLRLAALIQEGAVREGLVVAALGGEGASAEGWAALGRVYAAVGRWREADNSFAEGRKINAACADLWMGRGLVGGGGRAWWVGGVLPYKMRHLTR